MIVSVCRSCTTRANAWFVMRLSRKECAAYAMSGMGNARAFSKSWFFGCTCPCPICCSWFSPDHASLRNRWCCHHRMIVAVEGMLMKHLNWVLNFERLSLALVPVLVVASLKTRHFRSLVGYLIDGIHSVVTNTYNFLSIRLISWKQVKLWNSQTILQKAILMICLRGRQRRMMRITRSILICRCFSIRWVSVLR